MYLQTKTILYFCRRFYQRIWVFIWKTESCHDANFVVMGGNEGWHYKFIVMKTAGAISAEKVVFTTIFDSLCNWMFYSRHVCDIHYNDVIMTTIASQITSLMVVYSIVYSDADQRKHQSSASLAFVWGIHRDRWIPRTKGQLRGKCFHLMTSSWIIHQKIRQNFESVGRWITSAPRLLLSWVTKWSNSQVIYVSSLPLRLGMVLCYIKVS